MILAKTKVNDDEHYTSCHIFSGHSNGMIRIWSLIFEAQLNQFKLIRIAKLRGHTSPITAINITGNGNILLTGDKTGKLIKWGLSKQSLKAFHHLLDRNKLNQDKINNDDAADNDAIQSPPKLRKCTTTDFDTMKQSYGDTEKGIQAIERRAQKDEIKSKYQAFQLHFNHICNLQENLQQLSKIDENNKKKNKIDTDIECIRSELKSSLEILKRCKNELEEAKLSRSRVFCKFIVYLVSFWQLNSVQINQSDTVDFKIIETNVNNQYIVGCYNNYGQRVGIINNKQKMALILLMKQGVLFEGIIGKKLNDFAIQVSVTGYTWTNKNILIQKLKSTVGIDFHFNP